MPCTSRPPRCRSSLPSSNAKWGRRLLEKQGRGVRLTDAGRQLVVHTEQVLSMLERAEAELECVARRHRRTVVDRRVCDQRARPGAAGAGGPADALSAAAAAPARARARGCRAAAGASRSRPGDRAGLGERAAGAARGTEQGGHRGRCRRHRVAGVAPPGAADVGGAGRSGGRTVDHLAGGIRSATTG